MKALFIISDGFEDIEFTCPFDLLRRANVEITLTCGRLNANDVSPIVGKCGLTISNFKKLSEINQNCYDLLIIPGGPHFVELKQNFKVLELIKYFGTDKEKYLACICAAPSIAGELGLLKGKRYTVFPSMNEDWGGTFIKTYAVIDGHLITGDGPASALVFALSILKATLGEEVTKKIASQIYYERDNNFEI